MTMKPDYLLTSSLHEPTNAIAYMISHELADLYPDKFIVHGGTGSFDFDAYVRAGLCEARSRPGVLEQIDTSWEGAGEGLRRAIKHGWYDITWRPADTPLDALPPAKAAELSAASERPETHRLTLALLSWVTDGCETRFHWIVADTKPVAEAFFETVCEWAAIVRGEVLVFEDGDWEKDADLYQAIKNATFDNLTLSGNLKQEIQDDFRQFFDSRALYERYRLPWKRGVLLIGPPGNGKTHTVKALVNWLGQPCLYVKSFKSKYRTDQSNIRRVFERARHTTPCVLVLEDLDSLVDDKNRSFFLNELDGFASNTGIVVVATTNHPERLDVAILERPSRFDRKYHFSLPEKTERQTYILAWNDTLEPELRLSEAGIPPVVTLTAGFSYAYMKELFVSSMMRWISHSERSNMDGVMQEQAALLREQMHRMTETATRQKDEEEEDE